MELNGVINNKEIIGATSLNSGNPFIYDQNGKGYRVTFPVYSRVSVGYTYCMDTWKDDLFDGYWMVNYNG